MTLSPVCSFKKSRCRKCHDHRTPGVSQHDSMQWHSVSFRRPVENILFFCFSVSQISHFQILFSCTENLTTFFCSLASPLQVGARYASSSPLLPTSYTSDSMQHPVKGRD